MTQPNSIQGILYRSECFKRWSFLLQEALDRENTNLHKIRQGHAANNKKLDETAKILPAEKTPKSINLCETCHIFTIQELKYYYWIVPLKN